MDNVKGDNGDKKESYFYFYLDPSLINLNIVRHIGIENFSGSIIIETIHDIITQTIHLEEFAKKTIIPLRSQIERVLPDFQNEEEKKKVVNSIITCINRKISQN